MNCNTHAGSIESLVDAIEALEEGQVIKLELPPLTAEAFANNVRNRLYRERRKSQEIADFDYDKFSMDTSLSGDGSCVVVTFTLKKKPMYEWKVLDVRE